MSGRPRAKTNVKMPNRNPKYNRLVADRVAPKGAHGAGGDDGGASDDENNASLDSHTDYTTDTDLESFYPSAKNFAIVMRLRPK